jgi:hypothetical protein
MVQVNAASVIVSQATCARTVARLAHRTDDPLTRLVAKRVIALAKRGERDPDRICAETLKALGPAT